MNTGKYIYTVMLSVCLVLFLGSCADEIINKNDHIPPAFGKTNEITVLADQLMWEGPVGDTLDYYYTGAYPITPTPEPMLDIRHFNHDEITKSTVFKHYRSYIILANLGDKDSKITKMVIQDIGQEKYRRALKDPSFNSIVGKNKWARGQILVYLFAPTESKLMDVVKQKLPDITKRVYEHDALQLKGNTFSAGEHVIAQNALSNMLQIEGKIPKEFNIVKKAPQDALIWFRKDDQKSIQNIVVQSMEYRDQKQFHTDSIIARVNRFGANYIDNNVLRVNEVDLPTYEHVKQNDGRYIKEIRGIWETEKGYMGGPYVAQLIQDPSSKKLIFSLSFIFSPGEPKRNLIQRALLIMSTLRQQTAVN